MSSLVTDEIRAKATEYYRGNDVCMANARRLLKEVCLPNGLLPLRDVEECGYVEETGFVWLKQKKEIEHKFEAIDKLVKYGPEVTAYVEECKIKKLTGVKAKEFMFWVVINEITVATPESEKIEFKNKATGISKIFPTKAFVIEEPEIKEVEEKKEGGDEAKDVAKANKEVVIDAAAAAAAAAGVNGLDLKEKKGVEATPALAAGVEIKDV